MSSASRFAIMGHLIADYPDRKTALAMIDVMADAGVRYIEIQIPFSEPVADGPLFLKANHEALARGVRVGDAFDLLALAAKRHSHVSFLFMTYLNVVYRIGYAEFVKRSVAAGAKGCIVPDLPCEYATDFEAAGAKQNFYNVRLLPPNIDQARLELLCSSAKGFVYAVARSGVTGTKTDFGTQLKDQVARIKHLTKIPVAVGFGVATPDDVKKLRDASADIAVIGSEAMRVHARDGLTGLVSFWKSMSAFGAL